MSRTKSNGLSVQSQMRIADFHLRVESKSNSVSDRTELLKQSENTKLSPAIRGIFYFMANPEEMRENNELKEQIKALAMKRRTLLEKQTKFQVK